MVARRRPPRAARISCSKATTSTSKADDKSLSGVNSVDGARKERIVGRDESTLYLPGSLELDAGAITAESGSRLFFDAQGAVDIASNGNSDAAGV